MSRDMNGDKPKHKPQKKHTLSEVLKSLQDLIRTDLVTAHAAPAPTASARAPQAPAPSEPDTFNQALDRLDEIITQKIIEPSARTRSTPPEPLLPDEVIEINWEEAFGGEARRDRSDKTMSEAASAETGGTETIELQAIPYEPEAPATPTTTIEPAAESSAVSKPAAELSTIEYSSASSKSAPLTIDMPQTTKQAKAPKNEAATRDANTRGAPSTAADTEQHELFAATSPPETLTLDDVASATLESTEIELMAPADTSELKPESIELTTIEGSTDIPTVVVEYDGGTPESATIELETVDLPAATPAATEQPPAKPKRDQPKPREAERAAAAPAKPDATRAPKKPLELVLDTPPPTAAPLPDVKREAPRKVAPPKPGPIAPKPKAPAPRVPVQQEIPVLKEIAPVGAPPTSLLPSATQARDIAIRVIAKLNIERRKNGEPPLDIRTIERLQLYLADALSKREINKPK